MPEKKHSIDLIEHAGQGTGRQLGVTKPEAADNLDDLSDEELKQRMLQRGFELRKTRAPRQVFAKPDTVIGKTRISLHLPTELRKALKRASGETNKRESTIAAEAFQLWLDSQQLGD